MEIKKAIHKVKKLLVNIILSELKGIPEVAIPFSGSLDSSLVAFLVKNYTETKIQLYTIGFPDCYDFKNSKNTARILKLKVKYITLDTQILQEGLKEYLGLTNDKDKVSISYTLPFYLLLKKIEEKAVITGHGADTLFGGFHKYLEVKNLKLKIKSCYKEFLEKLTTRELQIAKKFNKYLILPFANKGLAEFVFTLPDSYLIKKGERKYLLRQVAEDLGLPKELTIQPKKSIQFTGISKSPNSK